MDHPLTAVYDANVLYPAPLHDLLIRLAQAGLVHARWTELIHDEWTRNVLAKNPHVTSERLGRTRSLMNEAIRDCLVTGYEDLIDSLTLPDPDDRLSRLLRHGRACPTPRPPVASAARRRTQPAAADLRSR